MQLNNYFSIFPKQQFHIIKFEDLITNPDGIFKEIYKFLGVNPSHSHQFDMHNAGKVTTRFPKVQHYVNMKISRPRVLKKFLRSILKRVNMTEIPPLRKETRELLLDRYGADLQLLRDIAGISFVD